MTADKFIEQILTKVNVNPDNWVEIKNETITDAVFLIDGIVVKDKIRISNCTFKSHFDIENWIFEGYVDFENCVFETGLLIRGGVFKKTLDLKLINCINVFGLIGGEFEKINLSFKNTPKLWISQGKFEELNLGNWVGQDDFEEMTIINSGQLIGDIKVYNKNFKKLYLGGGNSGKEFLFQDISCEQLHISNFTNSGALKVYGLEPKKDSTETYIQIVKSNLGKAQLFRVDFKNFSEVILVDSYLGETNIINSIWGEKNFRAIMREAYSETPVIRDAINDSEKKHMRDNFRQLKYVYEKQGDRINEAIFYSLEMNAYNSTLDWVHPLKDRFWQKLILILSRFLGNYGTSFLRPLIGILVSTQLVLLILIVIFDYHNLRIVLPWENNRESCQLAIGEYFRLLNPIHKMDDTLKGWAIMWDLFARIFSSYFIYNLVRASRRFIR